MTDAETRAYLEQNGYPKHVVEGGREGLVNRYRKFVQEVERGYDMSLFDYRNDLDGRAILHLIGADSEVEDLDARLEPLLIARDKRIWESASGEPFWDFGYPANARGELLQDLKSEGFMD
jgi:hypothetical protein